MNTRLAVIEVGKDSELYLADGGAMSWDAATDFARWITHSGLRRCWVQGFLHEGKWAYGLVFQS